MFKDEIINNPSFVAVSLSLESGLEEQVKFKIQSFHDLRAKLPFISVYNEWSTWYPDEHTLIFMRPRIDNCRIGVNAYISVEFDLSLKAYHKSEYFPLPHVTLCDISQLESVLNDISTPSSVHTSSEDIPTNSDNASHITSAESHIQQVIDNMYYSKSDDGLIQNKSMSLCKWMKFT